MSLLQAEVKFYQREMRNDTTKNLEKNGHFRNRVNLQKTYKHLGANLAPSGAKTKTVAFHQFLLVGLLEELK